MDEGAEHAAAPGHDLLGGGHGDIDVAPVVAAGRDEVAGGLHAGPAQQGRDRSRSAQDRDPPLAAAGDEAVRVVDLEHHDPVAGLVQGEGEPRPALSQPGDHDVVTDEDAQPEEQELVAREAQQALDRGVAGQDRAEDAGHLERPGDLAGSTAPPKLSSVNARYSESAKS